MIDISKLPMVSFVIATNKNNDEAIKKNIKELCGEFADINIMRGFHNISEAYDKGAEKCRHEIIVFMHDDVSLKWPKNWYEKVKKFMDSPTTGFLGLAGACSILDTGVWFEGLNEGWATHLSGSVSHGQIKDGKYNEWPTTYGPFGPVVVLDGVLLITSKKVLKKIGGFSKEIFGDFHFYDISSTLRATLSGLINYTVDLPVVHMSTGNFNPAWEVARLKFTEAYKDKLPIVINTIDNPDRNYGQRGLKIFGFVPGHDGCSFYRVKQPLDRLEKLGLALTHYFNPNELSTFDKEAHSFVEHTDAYLIKNGNTSIMKKIILNYDVRNRMFVFDSDDYDFKISPYNPFYGRVGLEDFWHTEPDGTTFPVWIDCDDPKAEEYKKQYPNVSFYNKKQNKQKEVDLEWMLKHSDLVTVTTQELADMYKGKNNNIKVVPNAIDFNVWHPMDFVKDKVRLCWMGGSSHYPDLHIMSQWLPKFLKKNKNCVFVILGDAAGASWIKQSIDADQLEYHGWVGSEAHPYRMMNSNIDIALVPLRGTIFDKGKSPIKVLEWGSMKIPSLVSNVTPYKQVVKSGENGVLFSTREEFLNGLERLVKDKDYRNKLGGNMYELTKEKYDLDKVSKEMAEIYEEAYFKY